MSLEEDYDDEVTALYRKWAGRVQGFLINMGTDRGLAEEITDDAFLAARRRWSRVRSYDRPEGDVFKIARNERSKRQKKHDSKARDLHPDPQATAQDLTGDLAQDAAERAAVRHALQQLPERQREAVILRDAQDFSEAATAKIMGVSTGTVKYHTSVGRQQLHQLLEDLQRRGEGNDQ